MTLVPRRGFEPRLADSKSAVLPLDERGVSRPEESNLHTSWYSATCVHSSDRFSSEACDRFPGLACAIFSTLRPAVALVALSLAACQSAPVKIQTVEVKVPVAVQPIKPAQVPAVPAPLGPRPESLSGAADLLLAKHCEFVAYALLADPLLRVSAGLPSQPLPAFPECERR